MQNLINGLILRVFQHFCPPLNGGNGKDPRLRRRKHCLVERVCRPFCIIVCVCTSSSHLMDVRKVFCVLLVFAGVGPVQKECSEVLERTGAGDMRQPALWSHTHMNVNTVCNLLYLFHFVSFAILNKTKQLLYSWTTFLPHCNKHYYYLLTHHNIKKT